MTVYEARKTMKYGPGRRPVVVHAGDEIPAPVKRNLIEFGWVAEVTHYSGRSWEQACKDRDLAEDIEIANMPDGPAKEHAKKWRARELDPSLVAQQTIHPTQYAKPGDYFNVTDPQAESAKRPLATQPDTAAQIAGPPQAPEVLPAALTPAAPAMPDTSDVPDVFAADDTEDAGELEAEAVDGDKPDTRPARKPRGRPRKR